MEELEQYEIDEQNEPFTITDDAKASWAMRKLQSIVTQQLANQAIADREILRCESWVASVNGKLQNQADHFRGLLYDYMRRQRENGRKSIDLPYGTIKSTARQPKVETDDEFVAWALKHAKDLLTFPPAPSPKPNLNEIKSRVKSGEKIEHVSVVEGGVSYSIEVKQ